jgi:DNA-binding PadR family transcriptional regulator
VGSRDKKAAGLTELEGSVLGMIGNKGPCTPYALRREFMDSPSQYWSASSGAAYPLVLRLARRGLIRIKSRTDDGREGNLYVLTAAGTRALRAWVNELASEPCISVPPDPLRNRLAFFDLLDKNSRSELLQDTIAKLKNYLEQVETYTRDAQKHQAASEYLISLGALRMVQARLEWLREVQCELVGPVS